MQTRLLDGSFTGRTTADSTARHGPPPGDQMIVSVGLSTDDAETKLHNVAEITPDLRDADRPRGGPV